MTGRNKILLILQAVAILSIMATAVQAATADSFQNPLNSYVISDGWRFGQNEGSGIYHAGEDLQAVKYEQVYAIANGKVVFRKDGPNCNTCGYGQVVVIEHELSDGSKICSIYGHLSEKYPFAAMNKTVVKGEEIGRIGDADENGDGGVHLHFGVRKGKFQNLLEGKVSLAGLSNFNKPSDYLNLIRAVNTPEVYRLANLGNKVWVSSSSIFNSCGWRWDDIRPVSVAERNSHSTSSGSPCFSAGTFIKRADSSEISLIKNYQDTSTIQNRFRHPFGSWDAFIRAGGKSDLSNVRIVSYSEYYTHAQGKTLT